MEKCKDGAERGHVRGQRGKEQFAQEQFAKGISKRGFQKGISKKGFSKKGHCPRGRTLFDVQLRLLFDILAQVRLQMRLRVRVGKPSLETAKRHDALRNGVVLVGKVRISLASRWRHEEFEDRRLEN